MPLYEFRCKTCGHRFEKIQSYSAADPTECPVCKGAVERLISAPSIQFKGSGFYSTDYPSRSSKAPAEGAPEKSGDGGSAKVVEGGASGDKGSSSPADKPGSGSSSSGIAGPTPASAPVTSSPASSKGE